ncbi:double-strand break repair protein AddB [Limimaricola sp. G21655-S1]|uniref:double-strand break repair protein AddB n=1 Tax=Limimaricola sp. G21655-S1 TaxID=3014768 RepID=UPI0022AF0601|nr:double-strand break repair protein AddB [Limimaricola sp. G21655-S1]MCZ4261329.1 double-strand break repair protein AddB [Limimaricola sp. G21655-S1]
MPSESFRDAGPFSDTGPAHLYALPCGVDFAEGLVAGLRARFGDKGPEAMARVTVYLNTNRMRRRVRDIFDQGPATLLPRLRLITDLALDPLGPELPLPVNGLRRRLELTQLVSRLIEAQPDLAPRAALYDLSDSLAGLMDEMQGEGVSPDDIAGLDVTDLSGHWARSLQFLNIVNVWFGPDAAPDREARQRMVVERLVERWAEAPPTDPVIVAGSTGSRGATALLLQAVARQAQGAVVLPGVDMDQPQEVWERLDEALAAEDHPQFRFRRILRMLEMEAGDLRLWHDTPAPSPERNRLVSLSLRPAPVTDQWRDEGPDLGDLGPATEGLTLLEAPSPRMEAETIALRMRAAVDEGKTVALVTPDRMLTRQVSAALDRWDLVADDSAGVPLPLTPPGRFLRLVSEIMGERPGPSAILSLLKHPLCHSGQDRGPHLLRTRELELALRREGAAYPEAALLRRWAEKTGEHDTGRMGWADWLCEALGLVPEAGDRPLGTHLDCHLKLAECLASGPGAEGSGGLWDEAAGRAARQACEGLAEHAEAAGEMGTRDYRSLFLGVLRRVEVRNPDIGHPQVLIRGTLEARVQGADLTILASMNEGSWPEAPPADPWLNRKMRAQAGLLLPERRIGLSAHDYQQAVAVREVWITRSTRSSDAETVPSRWINRLTNLLEGLPDQGGRAALAGMRARGADWLARATALSVPEARVPPAPRPSPRPPVAARPDRLSVTTIRTLIRDPYTIYARHVLRLRALDPLTPSADAALRGTVLHKVFETFLRDGIAPTDPGAKARLMAVTEQVLEAECPWPTVRRLWIARIARIADWFLHSEAKRQALATPSHFEIDGSSDMEDLGFTLTAQADRIDIGEDGLRIYDYKTGAPPSVPQQKIFEKQLLLEAAMAERGGFKNVEAGRVAGAAYIGLAGRGTTVDAPLDEIPPDLVWSQLRDLIARWQDPGRGYSARMAMMSDKDRSDYDHLSRFGEWDFSETARGEDVG